MLPKLVTTISMMNRLIFKVLLVVIFSFHSETLAQTIEKDTLLFETGEFPKMIEVPISNEFLQNIDSVIEVSHVQKDILQEAKNIHYKAFVFIQQKNIAKAKEAYFEALHVLNNTEYNLTKVKIYSGLGELAILEGNTTNAQEYFTKASNSIKATKYSAGINWILFHGGDNYIETYTLSEDELKQLVLFASYYLYSSPQRSLAASKWLIEQSGENKEYILDGYINAGLIYRDWGQFDKSLAQFFAAQKMGEQYSFGQRSKYSPLLNIAAVYDMQGQSEKSLETIEKVLKDATKDQDNWAIAYALKDLGITFMDAQENEKAETYFLRCIPIMEKLNNLRGIGVCYANLASVYLQMKHYEKATEVIEKALQLLKASNYDQLYASTLLLKAEMALKLGDWETYKAITAESLVILKRINSLGHLVKCYFNMSHYYEHTGNIDAVRKYVDSAFVVYKKNYEKSRLYESEKLKVRYESEKKEAQLAIQKKLNTALSAENDLNKSLQNTMFFIFLLSIVVLFLFFNRYKLQHRLAGEKERRNLAETAKLEEEMNHKQRELATLTLQMLKKNELLQELSQNIKKLEHTTSVDSKKEVLKLKEMIQSQNRLDQDWSSFKLHFDGVHPNFFNRLRKKLQNLTSQDERHCCYIKMGLSTKEIAQLMNISSSSVQMARYRLKKKLALGKEDDMYNFINGL